MRLLTRLGAALASAALAGGVLMPPRSAAAEEPAGESSPALGRPDGRLKILDTRTGRRTNPNAFQRTLVVDPEPAELAAPLLALEPPAAPPADADLVTTEAAAPGAAAPVGPVVDVRAVVAEGLEHVELPAAVGHLGPDPSWNQWRAAAVGFPYWLWVDPVGEVSTQVVVDGVVLRVRATPGPVIFGLGDGHRQQCQTTAAFVRGATTPGTPSPVCGYRWTRAGAVEVTVEQRWLLRWTAAGRSGHAEMARSGVVGRIEVAEFGSVVTG